MSDFADVLDRPPLQLAVGERVNDGNQGNEWPEFVFVTASHGTGWVPARHLSATSETPVVQTAYDTTELPNRTPATYLRSSPKT